MSRTKMKYRTTRAHKEEERFHIEHKKSAIEIAVC